MVCLGVFPRTFGQHMQMGHILRYSIAEEADNRNKVRPKKYFPYNDYTPSAPPLATLKRNGLI